MDKLQKQISALYKAEEKLASRTKALIMEIVEQIDNTNLEGVTPISSSVKCATVSFKTIKDNYKTNLSPSFYISDCQTMLLREKIASLQHLNDVKKFLNDAIDTGYIIVKGEKITFNPAVQQKLIKIQSMF